MRLFAALCMIFFLTACSGGQINLANMDTDRLPVDKKGNIFFGPSMEW
ncbi:MAG: hypothetical protein AAGO57_06620 [Pseudomonadota bacterium]